MIHLSGYELILTAIDTLALMVTLGMTYYAVRLVVKFRKGMLERPWQHISFGAIFLTAAGVSFAVQSAIDIPALSSALLLGGSVLSVIGGAFLLFGLRRENQVWSAKETETVPHQRKQNLAI